MKGNRDLEMQGKCFPSPNLSRRPVQQPGHKAHAACKRPPFDTSKTSVTVRCLWEKNWSLLPRGKASHWTGETGVIILLSQNEVNTMLDFAVLFAVRHSRGQIPQSKCLGRPQSPNPLQIFCDSDERDGQMDAQKEATHL